MASNSDANAGGSAPLELGPPPAALLMGMITGHWVTAAIYAAARLKLADALEAGPKFSDDLAAEVGAHPTATYRLMRALASLGIFEERWDRGFALTDLGQLLRSNHPQSLRDVALFQGAPPHWQGWGNFLHSVQTGQSAFEHVHNQGFFDYCETDEEFAAAFNGAMTGMTAANAELVSKAYDFSGIQHLADVGGGHGLLLLRLLQDHPHLRGTVVDLPHVVAGAIPRIAAANMQSRCGTQGVDFFRGPLPPANAYLAKHIIHDWDDEHSIRILQNMRDHLAPGGRVLLVECVITPGNERSMAKLMDLEMLHATHGGRERTREEFAELFTAAGLRLTRIVPTPSISSVIEAEAA